MLPEEKVKKLIETMNSITSVAIPPQPTIIELFDLAMDEKMLDYLLSVGTSVHTTEELKKIYLNMFNDGEENWKKHWDEVMLRGFIHQESHEERDKFILTPIFPGWIEFFTLGPKDPQKDAIIEKFMEFWKQLTVMNKFPFRQLSDGKMKKQMKEGMAPRFTVYPSEKYGKEITLNRELTSKQEVHTAKSMYHILEKHKDELCVGNCLCRSHKKISTGDDCDYDVPLQSCMMVGAIADNLVKNGSARKLTFEEAVAICNCCTDCCINYGDFKKGALSKVYTRSFYKPVMVDESACVGCDLCGKYCPTAATYYDKKKKKLVFNYENCVGCGQCVTQCKFSVRKMVEDERDVFVKSRNPKKI